MVLVEVEREAWRTVPDDVVLRCGLAAGLDLDRPLLRRLRRELRRAEALAVAGHALRRRDLSAVGLARHLERAGVKSGAEREALETLTAAGAIDDARVARVRATSLARRGWGNAAIAERLRGEGIGDEDIEAALSTLEPERQRAAALARSASGPRRAWALLTRRGFDPDAIEAAVGPLDEHERGGLG